jgi:hypothetical protein
MSSATTNHTKALLNPREVTAHINKELKAGRLLGPFTESNIPFPTYKISPLNLAEKKDSGKFRLVHDLSFPGNGSVNASISDENKSVQYSSVQDAITVLRTLGKNAYMAKSDISDAYRLIPLKESEYHMLGMQWNGATYFDRCLPQGCSSSSQIFTAFSDALRQIVSGNYNIKGVIISYLDDFLFISPSENECNSSLDVFLQCAQALNIPINHKKTVKARKVIEFLGIELDSTLMCARLPDEKIRKTTNIIQCFLSRGKARVSDVQSLAGRLHFACSVVRPGRPFIRRLINLLRGNPPAHHMCRISVEIKKDLDMWLEFLRSNNGVSWFQKDRENAESIYPLFTDSSESIGFGGVLNDQYFFGTWPMFTREVLRNITALELYPIVIAAFLFEDLFLYETVVIHSDNKAVVHILNKQTSRDPVVMELLRPFILQCMRTNVVFRAEWVPGTKNVGPDMLSRGKIYDFLQVFGAKQMTQIDIPPHLMPQNLMRKFVVCCKPH